MDDGQRELAQRLAQRLRWYMREKTSHNNIVAIPVMDLWAWAAVDGDLQQKHVTAAELEVAARFLHQSKICVIVQQGRRDGTSELRLMMTEECRDISDDAITARLFPERS